MSITATVTNISRCSLHDGPGVRTVVYLKGCGLRCRWCHNPETLSAKPEIMYIPTKCIHCGRCLELCPEHHVVDGNDMKFIREGCIKCGKCAQNCPAGALEMSGKTMTVEEVFQEVVKDKHYYDSTGGGITLSGGECLLHPEFSAALLKKCKDEGIHTTIETASYVSWESVEMVLPFVDLVYADLKIADPEKHREYTGQDNYKIIENIRKMSGIHSNIILRTPLIPGVNDSEEEMAAFAKIINTLGEGVQAAELLRYNNLASAKYELIGKEFESFGAGPQEKEQMEILKEALKQQVSRPIEIFYRM